MSEYVSLCASIRTYVRVCLYVFTYQGNGSHLSMHQMISSHYRCTCNAEMKVTI